MKKDKIKKLSRDVIQFEINALKSLKKNINLIILLHIFLDFPNLRF